MPRSPFGRGGVDFTIVGMKLKVLLRYGKDVQIKSAVLKYNDFGILQDRILRRLGESIFSLRMASGYPSEAKNI